MVSVDGVGATGGRTGDSNDTVDRAPSSFFSSAVEQRSSSTVRRFGRAMDADRVRGVVEDDANVAGAGVPPGLSDDGGEVKVSAGPEFPEVSSGGGNGKEKEALFDEEEEEKFWWKVDATHLQSFLNKSEPPVLSSFLTNDGASSS